MTTGSLYQRRNKSRPVGRSGTRPRSRQRLYFVWSAPVALGVDSCAAGPWLRMRPRRGRRRLIGSACRSHTVARVAKIASAPAFACEADAVGQVLDPVNPETGPMVGSRQALSLDQARPTLPQPEIEPSGGHAPKGAVGRSGRPIPLNRGIRGGRNPVERMHQRQDGQRLACEPPDVAALHNQAMKMRMPT